MTARQLNFRFDLFGGFLLVY